ncbi:MAG: DUF3536 domain-containing protein, partial [Cyanobacteria bacterium J06642_3]
YYQPPRENPYLNAIERQPGAAPAHNWNERIYHECYRPNAFARVLNDQGQVIDIVNNFEYLSFNVGPTLMSWLEKYDLEVYKKVIEGDRLSKTRLNGHGNAIAQVYNHIILPLANKQDKYTQIRWGKADFQQRFGRDPEGMWLAETAIDYPTVEALIDEEIRFIILAPSQAERCRVLPTVENSNPQWHEVGGSQIDPTHPYRCFIKDGRYIDIFFYDGPISRDMGFSNALNDADNLAKRLNQAIRRDQRQSQLISVATDGETFGHHKGGTEKCLAYAFTEVFVGKSWTVTNYAHYLSINPPTWEVVLKPVTAWSCSHGVERWRSDCGCGGGGTWQQKWRKPLRDSLDWLRDRLIPIFENKGENIFIDPWLARDEYVSLIDSARSHDQVEAFLERHQIRPLSKEARIEALMLLEMQRHCLLMYTSCGWFFDEISRPEGVQILRYASRAIELASEISGINLQPEFIQLLAKAPSNVEKFGDGAQIYRQLVIPSQISLEQVAAHYAISSLFNRYATSESIYCYRAEQLDYQRQQVGTMSLAIGQVKITSETTWVEQNFTFAVLHLGGCDFNCCIQPFLGKLADVIAMRQELFRVFQQGSSSQTIMTISRLYGEPSFNLQHLFPEERHMVMRKLTDSTKKRLSELYAQVYRENHSIILAFQNENLPIPQELRIAAEVSFTNSLDEAIALLELNVENLEQIERHLQQVEAVVLEVVQLNCQLRKTDKAKKVLEQLLIRLLWQILHDGDPNNLTREVKSAQKIIDISKQLQLGINLDRTQEMYLACLQDKIIPNCLISDQNCIWQKYQLKQLLKLGDYLGVDVSSWLYDQ